MIELNISQVEAHISIDCEISINEIYLLQLSFPEFIDLLINHYLFAEISKEKPI